MARVYLPTGPAPMIADRQSGGWSRSATPDVRAGREVGEPGGPAPRPTGRRMLWFVGLWAAGVGTLALVSFAIKSMLGR